MATDNDITRFVSEDGNEWSELSGEGLTTLEAWNLLNVWRQRQREAGNHLAKFEIWLGDQRLYPARPKAMARVIAEEDTHGLP